MATRNYWLDLFTVQSVAAARRRIAELDAEIAALEHPFSLNETPNA